MAVGENKPCNGDPDGARRPEESDWDRPVLICDRGYVKYCGAI